MAGWTKVCSQVLIYLNDQSVGPIAPYARLGIQTEAPDAVKGWKTKDTATVPMLAWSMEL